MTEIKKLLEIVKVATPGPWEWDEDLSPDRKDMTVRELISNKDSVLFGFDYYIEVSRPNAKFVETFNPQRVEQLLLLLKECYKAFHLISEYPEGFYPTNPKKMFSKVTADDMLRTFETAGLVVEGDGE